MKKAKTDLPQLGVRFPDQLSFCGYINQSIDSYMTDSDQMSPVSARKMMFVNHSWRLSQTGLTIMKDLFASYESTSESNAIVTGRILIGMDAVCDAPWALRGKTITVFDPMLHFELQMMGGKIAEYLDFKLPKSSC